MLELIEISQVRVRRIAGTQFNRLLQRSLGKSSLLRITRIQVGRAQIGINLRVIRSQFNGALILSNGLVVLPLAVVENSK